MASHVRCCVCDDQVVLLDLRRSRYLSLPDKISRALSIEVHGWPQSSDATSAPLSPSAMETAVETAVESALGRLKHLGLVTDDRSMQRWTKRMHAATLQRRPTLPPATSSVAFDFLSTPPLSTRDVLQFLRSATLAAWWLRTQSLDTIATRVARRRPSSMVAHAGADAPPPLRAAARAPAKDPAESTSPGPDAARLRAAALAFERLRPLAFTAHDRCLHDSLSLVVFLAFKGLSASWVIGVRTRPFGAHSWVQSGSLVLNDQHEQVRAFRPILVV